MPIHAAVPHQPLTIGQVISVGLALYRQQFKLYTRLSAIAFLWLFVPIYGWVKFLTIAGAIARLAHCELSGNPQSALAALTHTAQKSNVLFFVQVAIVSRSLLEYIVLCLAALIAQSVFLAILQFMSLFSIQDLTPGNAFYFLFALTVTVITLVLPFYRVFWFASRRFLTDIYLSVQDTRSFPEGFQGSLALSRGKALRLQAIALTHGILCLVIIRLPFDIAGRLFSNAFVGLANFIQLDMSIPSIGVRLLCLWIPGIIVMPFWQSTKAVAYYDLSNRKYGVDMQLRKQSNTSISTEC